MARPPGPVPPRPPAPSGVLFFVHGANQTSEGHAENVSRLEDEVRARGWDVTVVAPAWPPVADAGAHPARRRPARCRHAHRHELLRGSTGGPVRSPRPAAPGRR